MSFRNQELELANEYVRFTACNIFLTGKAGTGKTTFLQNLHKNAAKRMIVTAPTGVAAINAGGVTLHSFFQLPFSPFIPGSENSTQNSRRRFRFSREKKDIIRNLDLLVIDEISMVRADILDAVDATLRFHRRSARPFGGVQLLMIGDLHQLSPVAKDDERRLLDQYYDSIYFFSSKALANTDLITIELKHIYRQSDAAFIKILNQVRDNRLDQEGKKKLDSCCLPDFKPEKNEGYITLTTHNHSAGAINRERMKRLSSREHSFVAEITGDFPEHLYPTSYNLVLKEGAQVMFIRNDASPDKLYFNGKIGRLSRISKNGTIMVKCPEDRSEIAVKPITWQNINYTLDKKTKEINEKVIGEFRQYPLKPAWAITIHKSQGLTFDKAIIDPGRAFTHGQVYVALSRCRTLDGMVLVSPINTRGMEIDRAIIAFDERSGENSPSREHLQAAKTSYQKDLLLECFDFGRLANHLNYLSRLLTGNASLVQVLGVEDINLVRRQCQDDIVTVGENFKRQLNTLFSETVPESDPVIQERTTRASKWFQNKFDTIFSKLLHNMRVETDNRELGRKITRVLNNLKEEISKKVAGIKSCEQGFSPVRYLRALSSVELKPHGRDRKKKQTSVYRESDIGHRELFQTLKEWRAAKAGEKDVAPFQILHQKVIIQIAVYLPETIDDLMKIKGAGRKTAEKYGQELVDMVRDYRERNKITEVVLPEPDRTADKDDKPVTDTKETSFNMFNSGLTVSEIAEKRGLVTGTIEGHLAFFVARGKLDIDRLLSPERQEVIDAKLNELGEESLGEIKRSLGDGYSYGEIKIMLAHRKYLSQKSSA